MNIQRGLERVSAVWWGFLGIIALAMLIGAVFGRSSDRGELAAMGAGGLIAVYIAHRITCWVVAGFFAPRS